MPATASAGQGSRGAAGAPPGPPPRNASLGGFQTPSDRVRVIDKFADDEANSRTKTVLLMKIGGGNHGIGIHGTHLGPGVTIRYAASDQQRQNIPWVEYNGSGRQTLYATADA